MTFPFMAFYLLLLFSIYVLLFSVIYIAYELDAYIRHVQWAQASVCSKCSSSGRFFFLFAVFFFYILALCDVSAVVIPNINISATQLWL